MKELVEVKNAVSSDRSDNPLERTPLREGRCQAFIDAWPLKSLLYATLLVAANANVFARGADATRVEECRGADAWARSHPDPVSPEAKNSDTPLLTDLRARVESDQAARKKWLIEPKNEDLASAVSAIDAANVTWLRKLIMDHGFPTAAQVGNEGVHLAWVLLQHADQDPELQREMLPILEKRFSSGELPANDLARITDRILLADGRSQKYGTQFDWFAGEFKLPDAKALAEMDSRRNHLGLMPLADYVCTVRKARMAIR